ncbi:MAG: NUDIX domain-containing protein [Bacilli bacterium]
MKQKVIDYIPYLRKKVGHDYILTVGVSCLILDEEGRVLLEKRTDNGLYCRPGGSLDLGETVEEGVRREVLEETGLRLKSLTLYMIRSGEKTDILYPNGDKTNYVDLVFLSSVKKEELDNSAPHDGESISLSFFSLDALPPREEMLNGTMECLERLKRGEEGLLID